MLGTVSRPTPRSVCPHQVLCLAPLGDGQLTCYVFNCWSTLGAPAAEVGGLWLWRTAGTKRQLVEDLVRVLGPGVSDQDKVLLTGLSCLILEAGQHGAPPSAQCQDGT